MSKESRLTKFKHQAMGFFPALYRSFRSLSNAERLGLVISVVATVPAFYAWMGSSIASATLTIGAMVIPPVAIAVAVIGLMALILVGLNLAVHWRSEKKAAKKSYLDRVDKVQRNVREEALAAQLTTLTAQLQRVKDDVQELKTPTHSANASPAGSASSDESGSDSDSSISGRGAGGGAALESAAAGALVRGIRGNQSSSYTHIKKYTEAVIRAYNKRTAYGAQRSPQRAAVVAELTELMDRLDRLDDAQQVELLSKLYPQNPAGLMATVDVRGELLASALFSVRERVDAYHKENRFFTTNKSAFLRVMDSVKGSPIKAGVNGRLYSKYKGVMGDADSAEMRASGSNVSGSSSRG